MTTPITLPKISTTIEVVVSGEIVEHVNSEIDFDAFGRYLVDLFLKKIALHTQINFGTEGDDVIVRYYSAPIRTGRGTLAGLVRYKGATPVYRAVLAAVCAAAPDHPEVKGV